MSSEIIYKDAVVIVKESFAELLICYLLKLTENDIDDVWLTAARTVWHVNRKGKGLGMTDLGLDEILRCEIDEHRMLSILDRLTELFSSKGEFIRASEINSLRPPYTNFCDDVPVEEVRGIIRRVRKLIDA